jgi:hypothetical protein
METTVKTDKPKPAAKPDGKPKSKAAPSHPVPYGTKAQHGGKMVGPAFVKKQSHKGR